MKRFLVSGVVSLASTLPALADAPGGAGNEYGHMMGWGHGYAGPFLMLFWLVVLVAAVVLVIRLLDGRSGAAGGSSALATLDERFARGEIDAEEYQARKKLLKG